MNDDKNYDGAAFTGGVERSRGPHKLFNGEDEGGEWDHWDRGDHDDDYGDNDDVDDDDDDDDIDHYPYFPVAAIVNIQQRGINKQSRHLLLLTLTHVK